MLKRDPAFIATHMTIKDDGIYTDRNAVIEFPSWYADRGLYQVTEHTNVYGLFAIIMDDKYSVSIIPTIIYTNPLSVGEIERDGIKYTQLTYAKGDKIIETQTVVMQTFLIYDFFDTYFMQAKVPWYIGYDDLRKIMGNTAKYAASGLGESAIANETITSFITRTRDNKLVFHRQDPSKPTAYVDLMDVRFSTLSTVNKLAGNYFEESMVSALVQKEKSSTTLENIVRK